jgi:hypothetical protein
MSFQIKYLKYKNKYLGLKNLLTQKGGGGSAIAEIIDSQQIRDYLNSETYDFKLFDINYTEQEQESIDNFKIEKKCSYNYNGSISSLKINDLNTFLSEIGPNTKKDIDNVKQIILNLIKKVLKGYDMENFLLIIRVRVPDSEFDIPRWHRDGPYFGDTIITSKFATVLKGPGTLFIKSSTDNSEKFNELYDQEEKERIERREKISIPFTKEQEEIDERYRALYATLPKNSDMVQLGKNQGVIFFADSGGIRGAIHSEPKLDENRIFISIVPGTKENVEERDELEKMIHMKAKI